MNTERRDRATTAVAFALIAAVFVSARVLHEPNWPTDFDQLWHAARALLAGRDPYTVVGPGKAFPWEWPLYYPLPAVLIAVPFSFVPVAFARIAFSTVGAALLGWALGSRARTHWPLLLSASFLIASSRAQWAPMLLAAAWMPASGFLSVAKPNVEFAVLAASTRRSVLIGVAGSAALVALSFLVEPHWAVQWTETIRAAPHIQSAVTRLPAGPLLALAAFRWRRPEARLFLALALLPHTPSVYDLLLLFFVCRTLRESLVLAVLTQALYWSIVLFGSFSTFDAYADWLGNAAVVIVYAPVLIVILRRPDKSEMNEVEAAKRPFRAVLIPENWLDAVLLSILLVAGTMLVWLPLVTYR